jgi:hypothetical protein
MSPTIVWMVIALAISTKTAPLSGTETSQRRLATCALVLAVMTGIVVGVAPMADPKRPEVDAATL